MNTNERWDKPSVYLDHILDYLDGVNLLLQAVKFADTAPYNTQALEPQHFAKITDVYKQIKSISQTINDIKTELERPRDEDTFFSRVRAIQKETDCETNNAIKIYKSKESHNDD